MIKVKLVLHSFRGSACMFSLPINRNTKSRVWMANYKELIVIERRKEEEEEEEVRTQSSIAQREWEQKNKKQNDEDRNQCRTWMIKQAPTQWWTLAISPDRTSSIRDLIVRSMAMIMNKSLKCFHQLFVDEGDQREFRPLERERIQSEVKCHWYSLLIVCVQWNRHDLIRLMTIQLCEHNQKGENECWWERHFNWLGTRLNGCQREKNGKWQSPSSERLLPKIARRLTHSTYLSDCQDNRAATTTSLFTEWRWWN